MIYVEKILQSFEAFDDQDEVEYDDSFEELGSYAILKNHIHDLPKVYTNFYRSSIHFSS